MRRRGGRRGRWICRLVVSLAVGLGLVQATEPDGAVALRYAFEPDGRIRLTLQPLAPLDGVRVSWTGAGGAALRAVLPEGTEGKAEAVPGGERLDLGRLPAGSARSFLLELSGQGASAPTGIAVVHVEGSLRGRPIRESLGIPLSRVAPGRPRLDAIEFDASTGSTP